MNNQELEAIELQNKQAAVVSCDNNNNNSASSSQHDNRERANYFTEISENNQKYPTADDAIKSMDNQNNNNTNNNNVDDVSDDVKKLQGAIAVDVPNDIPVAPANRLPFDMNIFFQRVFGIMFFGLVLTACVSLYLQHIDADVWLNNHPAVFILLLVAELVVVIAAVLLLRKISFVVALAFFILYAILNGVTLTPVVAYYTSTSVALAFFSAAGVFLSMSLYGYFTKRDLDSWGPILFGALWGLIIAGLLNLFIGSSLLQFGICVAGVVLFAGMTAFDIQKLRQLGDELGNKATTDESSKIAVYGALNLYLDFINLFLYILELVGQSKN